MTVEICLVLHKTCFFLIASWLQAESGLNIAWVEKYKPKKKKKKLAHQRNCRTYKYSWQKLGKYWSWFWQCRVGYGAQNTGLERGEFTNKGALTFDPRFNILARTHGRLLYGLIGKFFEVHTWLWPTVNEIGVMGHLGHSIEEESTKLRKVEMLKRIHCIWFDNLHLYLFQDRAF